MTAGLNCNCANPCAIVSLQVGRSCVQGPGKGLCEPPHSSPPSLSPSTVSMKQAQFCLHTHPCSSLLSCAARTRQWVQKSSTGDDSCSYPLKATWLLSPPPFVTGSVAGCQKAHLFFFMTTSHGGQGFQARVRVSNACFCSGVQLY